MTTLGESIGIASVSRYRFTEHLATGGMAEIYAAEAIGVAGVTRQVAVKRVLREHAADTAFLQMFANEARLAVRLQHPNIVQTYDVLDVKGELYITMELLEGISLLDLLRLLDGPEPALTVAQSIYVVERILAGLHYAHERLGTDGEWLGIVHRDVSPHNVFLTLDGNVKLVDFGIAKVAARNEPGTETGVVKGKVLYMSPEHCQGTSIDRRADIFSAGLLLYALVTNRHPFKGKNPYETMHSVIHDVLVPAIIHSPELPPALDAILTKALQKNPDDRYPTARAMQEDLAVLIRTQGLYTTDSEFSKFIQNESPTLERSTNPASLPPDLVFGVMPQVHTGRHPAANSVLAETPHGSIERIFGVVLLKLHGVIDERFDPEPLVKHLKGRVLIDTSGIVKITSYGIRGLLQVYNHIPPDSTYHMRCSVAFIQQVGMVRMLLGGGKVVSFHLPYVDPVNGNPFTVLVSGRTARKALERQIPPQRTCPGFPDRDACFDDDPAAYLCFFDHFLEKPQDELNTVIKGLAAEHQRRQVEKAVDETGTQIWIRRPLQASFRWRNLLEGIEGKVVLDLEDTPSWTTEGIEALVSAVAKESEALQSLTVLHAPLPLLRSLADHKLADMLTNSTARVHASCKSCGVPRRVAVPLDRLSSINVGSVLDRCPTCGDQLLSNEELEEVRFGVPVSQTTATTLPVETVPGFVWAVFAMGVLAVIVVGWLLAVQ